MTETEAPEVDVDDLLTQAQDAMFDSNIAGAIQLCKEVISKKPRESMLCGGVTLLTWNR